MPTPEEIVKAAMAKVTKPTDISALVTPKSVIKTKADEVKTEPAKWDTDDGLPPRYMCGNLEPVNAKK